MEKELKNQIETNLLVIDSKDSAFGISSIFNFSTLNIKVIGNNEDSEILVISTIIKTLTDFYLMHSLNMFNMKYQFNVEREDECFIIDFFIRDEINFN